MNQQPVEATMSSMKRLVRFAGFVVLVAASGAYAQVSTINSAVVTPRVFNDVTNATFNGINSYSTFIAFTEQNVSQPTGFANRDVWRFSNNGGTSAYQFNNNDFFQVSMTLTLIGSPITPRKEAGFLLSTIGGDGQFIVNSDGHEVVAFGGPLPFYAFPSTYNSGDTITLGMTYFLDSNGKRAVIYSANGVNSPAQEFSNLEQGIIDNSTLGGYLQVVNAPLIEENFAQTIFGNINITIPEPSVFVLLGLGILSLVLRRRR
jgi:hypothetical protein